MKSKKIKFLEIVLRWMAVAVLKRCQPTIIGITGSVGKTSTKEAIFSVLSKKFNVRKSEKNYNNEVGIPLTILGSESGGGSYLLWLGVFIKWLGVICFPRKFPEIIIVELGVDHPGDMEYLTSFIKPIIGVVTNVSGSHLEFFGSVEKISKEKGVLIDRLPVGGKAILNMDDENVAEMQKRTKADVITYGFSKKAQLNADMIVYNYDDNQKPAGISFKLEYDGSSVPVRLPYIFAPHQVYAALAAIAVGLDFKMSLLDAVVALEDFHSPVGRMNLLAGIKNTYIIDDTYNASPFSVSAALEVLEKLGAQRKVAVLGDMLELGSESEKSHIQLIEKVLDMGVEKIILVGRRMEKAIKNNFLQNDILVFVNPEIAGYKLQEIMHEGDLILVKGSQGMRMEKVVEEIMAEPQRAFELLCRQNRDWKKREFVEP